VSDTTLLDLIEETDTLDSIQSKFEAFHQCNPWVYTQLVRMTYDLVHRGHNRVGIAMLFEVLRWETMMHTTDPSHAGFKLNNNYRSRYARKIMADYPDLAGVFETRGLHS